MFIKNISIFILITLFPVSFLAQEPLIMPLDTGWLFSQVGKNHFLPAKVPGNVFLDLLANGLIPHPYYADNEKKVQWVSKKDWIYRLDFPMTDSLRDFDNINMVFEGLDTHADVFLNGKKILRSDNMFLRYAADIKKHLKKKNRLEIYFRSPVIYDSLKAAAYHIRLPDNRAFSRKAPYQYGWDWGPRLITMGIWKDVRIEFYNNFKIKDIFIKQKINCDTLASLRAVIEVDSDIDDKLNFDIKDKNSGDIYIAKKIEVHKGKNTVALDFLIKNPKLWYPAGMGKQNLYHFTITADNGKTRIRKDVITGLRTVKLVQQPDSTGSTFYFEVNGSPLYIKGANYVPADNFPSTLDSSRYERLISDAANSNMNMLRVWGGGVYEDDYFYELCDKYGIMVWQDFMFACNFYPAVDTFVENVMQEARYQVTRLRNHPCIALWCGNNEVDEAWFNWGYQKALKYTEQDSLELRLGYIDLFEKKLPAVVDRLIPGIPYIPTSPKIGWGHKEALYSGDMHYWGVWWGEEPFEVYEEKVGRFMSEYGFQAFPSISTLAKVIPPGEMNLTSPALLNHQKHPRGMQLIEKYMRWYFPVPADFEDYVYVSQLLQSYGIIMAIEAHRRAKPYNMGTLYWQYNDSWPVISWSSRDYYGNWKALQYRVKKACRTVIISQVLHGDSIDIYVVSDSMGGIQGNLNLQLMTFEGEILYKKQLQVSIAPGESKVATSLPLRPLMRGYSKDEVLLFAELKSNDNILVEKTIYLSKPLNLKISTNPVDLKIQKHGHRYLLSLSAPYALYGIQLQSNIPGFFSDNYFDMIPGKSYQVTFEAKDSENTIPLKITYRYLCKKQR